MTRLLLVAVVVVSAVSSAAEVCEQARIRDTGALATAIAQDKVLATTFQKTAVTCAERGEACDQARIECGGLLTSIIQKQVGFDEGGWLRDMLLPYAGQQYPMTRTFQAAQLAPDASCNVDVATLNAAAQRRTAQATRRENLLQEYQLYVKWAQAAQQKCRERAAADDAKAAAAKAESERLAAAAAAAAAAEASRQKAAEEAAKQKAEAEKRAREAADAQARKQEEQAKKQQQLAEEQARAQKEAQEQARRDAKEAAEKQAKKQEEAEERARDEKEQAKREAKEAQEKAERKREEELEQAKEEREREKREAEKKLKESEEARKREKEEAEDKARREKEAAEEKAARAEEERKVRERDTRIAQLRQQKEQLVADAEAVLKHAQAVEAEKKKAALDAVNMSPAVSQAAVAEAAEAEKARLAAEKNLIEAKQKAEKIVIDDSFERSRGSIAIYGGGGAASWWPTASNSGTGFAAGAMANAHLGFWGTAPSEGMASGFELRLSGRYFSTVGAAQNTSVFEALATGRYYFGRFAVGAAGELRLFDPALSVQNFGVGASAAVAFVDTKEMRVLLSANYLPVGTVVDPTRFTGDFEISYSYFSLHLNGGTFTQNLVGGARLSWQFGAFVGARLFW